MLLSNLLWSYRYEILCMARQLYCHGMCKIYSNGIPYNGVAPKQIFHWIWIAMEKLVAKWPSRIDVLQGQCLATVAIIWLHQWRSLSWSHCTFHITVWQITYTIMDICPWTQWLANVPENYVKLRISATLYLHWPLYGHYSLVPGSKCRQPCRW